MSASAYTLAQVALANLKSAIYLLLLDAADDGLRNVDVSRKLGIHTGINGRHEGYIAMTILDLMKEEGVVEKHDDRYRLRR